MKREELEFIEGMGRHFEAEGVPRIGGRMLGFLLLQDSPCSLDDLAGALSVSKASISTNARLLQQWGGVNRVSKPGDRRDYYVAAPDQTQALELRLRMMRELCELLRQGAEVAGSSEVRSRLDRMERFTTEAMELLGDLLQRWRSDAAS